MTPACPALRLLMRPQMQRCVVTGWSRILEQIKERSDHTSPSLGHLVTSRHRFKRLRMRLQAAAVHRLGTRL
jgi:hypothetical protein